MTRAALRATAAHPGEDDDGDVAMSVDTEDLEMPAHAHDVEMSAPAGDFATAAHADAGGIAPAAERSLRWLRGALILFAVIIAVQAALGFAGALTLAPAVLLLLAAALSITAIVRLRRRGNPQAAATAMPASTWSRADCAGAAALAVAFGERCWAGLHRSTFLYDVLSYHLHLPASWRAAGNLRFVPTPFGDPAAAYAPSNAELFYHLLLAAAGNARLAHAGQIPFAALATLALYATARLLGCGRALGFATALAFLLIPEIWQQAATAMADLATAAFFLSAVPFLLRLENRRLGEDDRRRALSALALAVGLLIGTKYVSVVLALPLVGWSAFSWRARGPRPAKARGRSTLPILLGVVFCSGGFWYLRNLLVSGNPLFPATLRLGGWTVAAGLYDSAMIRSSPYHLRLADIKPLLEILTEGGWGLLAALAAVVITSGPLQRARTWRWIGLAALLLALNWTVVPYQESRFFFSFWGVTVIAVAARAGAAGSILQRARDHRPFTAVGLIGLILATAGSILQFPTPGRCAVVAGASIGAVCGPWLWRGARRASVAVVASVASSAMPARPAGRLNGAMVLAAALAACAVVSWARLHPVDAPYVVGDWHDDAWAWLRSAGHNGQTIAYTGSNLPFPLWGPRLENRVWYTSVAGGPFSAPHDYLHVPATAPTRVTSEPAPERQEPIRAVWLANLHSLRIQLLFVAALYPQVQRTILDHDGAGFPIERVWADSDPGRFPLLFANEGVRIYAFRDAAPGGDVP